MSDYIKEIEARLNEAFQQCDDDTMENCIKELSLISRQRKEAASILFRALLLRPWDGNMYDPKSWREEVRLALLRIYELNELSVKDELSRTILELFENPIEQLGPVQDLLIDEQKYCEWLAGYWELVFEAINAKQEDELELLVELIVKLDDHLGSFWESINKDRAQFGLLVVKSFEDISTLLNQ